MGDSSIAELLGPNARYEPVRLLGRGGMGEVYEARHRALGSRVVLKLIRADRADNPLSLERMRREAQALARLTHPNLVRVTDFDITPSGQPFFIMEFLEGRSLADELAARKRLGLRESIDIAIQVLEGLATAHEVSVIHRDIKPDNIFLGRIGGSVEVKILDFGIAKLIATAEAPPTDAALTVPGRLLGTPRYVAPEQARLLPLDARVDLYAVGLVLYEMLTGRSPFEEATTSVEVIRMHLGKVPDPPSRQLPGLSPALEAIVMRCLEKQPERRFASARDLSKALRDVARSIPIEAPPPPVVAEPRATPAPAILESHLWVAPASDVHATRSATTADVPTVRKNSHHEATEPTPLRARDPRRISLPWALAILIASGVVASLAVHFLQR